MCGRRPSPPPLPEPEPVDSPIEETADRVVVGERRKKVSNIIGRKRTGTASLQIPLLADSMQQLNNLNYPM